MTEPAELSAAVLRGVAALWKKTNRELKARFGGNSMRPTIAPGQEVVLHCTDDVSVGDVIVYIYLDQVIVHRLIARTPRWLVTRGDAHTIPDPPVASDAVVGKIAGVPPAPRSLPRTIAFAATRAALAFGPAAARAMLKLLHGTARLLRHPREQPGTLG